MINLIALVKPAIIGVCAVGAVGLTSAGEWIASHSGTPRERVIVVPSQTPVPGPTVTIIRPTVVPVPVQPGQSGFPGAPSPGSPAPGVTITQPGQPGQPGPTVTLPGPTVTQPGPTATVTQTPAPGPTVTVTPTPSPTCVHPPGHKCRHLPHPTVSVSVDLWGLSP